MKENAVQAIEIEAPIDLRGNIHLSESYPYLYGRQARFVILLPDNPQQPAEVNLGDDRPAPPRPGLAIAGSCPRLSAFHRNRADCRRRSCLSTTHPGCRVVMNYLLDTNAPAHYATLLTNDQQLLSLPAVRCQPLELRHD
jgi:hypothetical protein